MQDEAMDNDLLSQYMKELEKLELPTEPNFWKPAKTGFEKLVSAKIGFQN